MKILKAAKNAIPKIQQSLQKGEVIIFPTDTVYGLICDATNKKAIDKLFEIKKRPFKKPIGIFVKEIEMAKRFAKIDERQEKFLRKLGKKLAKITFIFKKKNYETRTGNLSGLVGAGETIGIRIPDYKLIKDLFEKIDFPLAQTSANISGQPATTKIKEVLEQFEAEGSRPDLLLDAGNLPEAKPSTVVDLTAQEPRILRKGEITLDNSDYFLFSLRGSIKSRKRYSDKAANKAIAEYFAKKYAKKNKSD